MKLCKLIFSLAVLFLGFHDADAQVPNFPVNEETKLIEYSAVVQTEGNKNALYDRCIEWVNGYYKNPAGVLRLSDKENGKIEGKHQFFVYNTLKDGTKVKYKMVKYSFVLQFKDGRYKYTITDFNLKATSYFPIERWIEKSPEFDAQLQEIDAFAKALEESLKEGMVKKAEKQEEAW